MLCLFFLIFIPVYIFLSPLPYDYLYCSPFQIKTVRKNTFPCCLPHKGHCKATEYLVNIIHYFCLPDWYNMTAWMRMTSFLGGMDINAGKRVIVTNTFHFYQYSNGSASRKGESQTSILGKLNKTLPQGPTLKLPRVLSNIKPVLSTETLLLSKHDK